MRKLLALSAAVGALTLGAAGSASALTVVSASGYSIDDTSFGGQTGVHFVADQIDVLSADARVNQDDSTVVFSSTDTFDTDSAGEAVISDSLGKGKTDPFNNLTVTFGHAWDKVTFSFDGGPADMAVNVNGGAAIFSVASIPACTFCTISTSGQNKFTVYGNGTTGITSLAFSFSQETITSGRQFRVLDVANTPIPEPATWAMMIGGFGGVGAMMRRRRLALA